MGNSVEKRSIKYGAGITKEVYQEKYPQLAEALETVLQQNKTTLAQVRLSYEGHLRPTGQRRTLTIQSAIDVLEEAGYKIDIKVTPPKNS